MPEEYLTFIKLTGALLGGYVLGSIPFALWAARSRGVDIFATGSNTAGAANVFWHIGRRPGALVFAGDAAKGSAAVLIASLLDLPPLAVLMVAGAAIMGHWKSVFSGFRGGDGMATLMGVTITLEPALSAVGIVVGLPVLLALWRAPLRSAGALLAGFTVILGASQLYQLHREMIMGLAVLAMMVLFHTIAAKWRRLRCATEGKPEIYLPSDQPPGYGPTTAKHR